MREPESITVNDDARVIPVWSIVVSVVAFALVEYYFWVVMPHRSVICRRSASEFI